MENKTLFTNPSPSKIYIETTTRCNLNCGMCVKHTAGSGMTEGDFDMTMFEGIKPALPEVQNLILSGIGEPLLYPQLEKIIREARALMPESGIIAFQSNGMLMSKDKSEKLIRAGLDKICISLDSVNPETFSLMRNGGDISRIKDAFRFLKDASAASGRQIQTGVEFVLTRENMQDLPDVIKFAAEHGASFVIVTHLIPYSKESVSNSAYDRNTDAAVELYETTLKKCAFEGIDITQYFKIKWKIYNSEEEKLIIDAVDKMTAEAREKNIFFHLHGIMNRDHEIRIRVEELFKQSAELSKSLGIELSLPAVSPAASKRCEFIESGSVFVSWNGDVHPCHFLWHKFQCYVSGWQKYVNPKSFGNLSERNIVEIWNSNSYKEFRETVSKYNYPVCSNCSFAPCDYIYSEEFEQDCYINSIPCCDCQWCLGIFQCLR
jgi:putative metalloenzyme radical SAM/SPASM domain maturase